MVDRKRTRVIQSFMTKINKIFKKLSVALLSVFAPKRKTPQIVLEKYPLTEADRYMIVYSRNRSAPYFGEDDEASADGLVTWG